MMKTTGLGLRKSWLLGLFLAVLLLACRRPEEKLQPRSLTWAELRAVRAGVLVTPPGEGERNTYPQERLADGAKVRVEAGGLAWLRRDGGATLLVRGPARLIVRARSLEVAEGRVFVDTPKGSMNELSTPGGELSLAAVRASITVPSSGATRAYVLAGEVRAGPVRARAGEELALEGNGKAQVAAGLAWEDWTGGFATTDRAPAPAPFGVGTVGARRPGEQGAPRFALSIQRMDVRVTIDGDFAWTEVDQYFFNPSSNVVEGVYGFRTPERAILQGFGVDRDGVVVWGRVKEKAAAAAQYQANVYQGSTEDPALLEWTAPGVYQARLYPIGPGETRRVVVRYAEWLERSGPAGRRRLYTYPMAAEGAEDSLPHVEELKVSFDVSRAGAQQVTVGMAGARRDDTLIVRAQDFVPRADLALELFDEGIQDQRAYRAPHGVDLQALAPEARPAARDKAAGEADYVLVPIRAPEAAASKGGLDLVIVIDASAATEPATLAIARAATGALLAHLGEQDRAVVLAGDDGLRPVVAKHDVLYKLDAAARLEVEDGLSALARGGATDLGAMLTAAGRKLESGRRGAVVYIGDAAPTVGELSLGSLRERLGKEPAPVRIYGLGIGDAARLDILAGLAQGGFATRVSDGFGAARAALRVLEDAERPVWLGNKIDLGPSVERLYPRDARALVTGETLWAIGRLMPGKEPTTLKLAGSVGQVSLPLRLQRFEDHGDLSRRWAEARLTQMLEDGEGRAALVDLGMKHHVITPVTSWYVPTKSEMSEDERAELAARSDQAKRAAVGYRVQEPSKVAETSSARFAVAGKPAPAAPERDLDNKEGGTGTRAKGEEGSMGRRLSKGPSPDAPPPPPAPAASAASAPEPEAEAKRDESPRDAHLARQAALREAHEFGMIGALSQGAAGDPLAAPKAASKAPDDASAMGNMWGDEVADGSGTGGLGLSGTGAGGGGREPGVGLGAIGTLGSGAASGVGQGFGAGHGRLGGSHGAVAPRVRAGQLTLSGRLPPEVVGRIVRQNFGRFRLCYEQGLGRNPNLEGKVRARFVIGRDGNVSNVSNGGSDLPDSGVVSCVLSAFYGLTFPQPEGGIATVVYPVELQPGGGAAPARSALSSAPAPSPRANVNVNVFIGDLPRRLLGCSAAASAPLEERVGLWRERLAKAGGNAQLVAGVYRSALGACEAPTSRERVRLLMLMLDAVAGISGKVELYRTMGRDLGAADVLYRGLLARIKTPEDMRELHGALGLKTVDPGVLSKLVDGPLPAAERAQKLAALWALFPDDLTLGIALLHAYEDADSLAAARDFGHRLRQRPDADARVRTAVGELYLRLARRAEKAAAAALLDEGRRAFGEIVEFSPEDPVARRRLGDLLLSHGFFDDAARQYQTLARLTPDEPKVLLLLAKAAEGRGLLEEALKWSEKAGAHGAPDAFSGVGATARALAATHLAWARVTATEGKRTEELEALLARATRVLSSSRIDTGKPHGARVSLSWTHPELHPSLWTNALGAPMPAPEGDISLGISQAIVPENPNAFVEVRLEPADLALAARLGASVELTIVVDELGKQERIIRKRVIFERGGAATRRFKLDGSEVRGG